MTETTRGGYRGMRDPKTGLTPREEYYKIQTQRNALELAKERKLLVALSEVEAAHAEMREVIKADLLGALPLRMAALMAGKKLQAHEVRSTALKAVNEMLRRWHKASIPTPEVKDK